MGQKLFNAEARGDRAVLQISDVNGKIHKLEVHHVIAATGYKFNLHNLPFLSEDLKFNLELEQQSPRLSPNFESTVPGLYFTGLARTRPLGV